MADHPSKEFHEFNSLMRKLVKVPKATISEKMAHHRAKVKKRTDPARPGRKRKNESR